VKAEYSQALGTTTIDAADPDRQSFGNSSSESSLMAREEQDPASEAAISTDKLSTDKLSTDKLSSDKVAVATGRYVTTPKVRRVKPILYGACLVLALSIGSFCAYQYLNGKSGQSQALASRVAPPAVTVSTAEAKIQEVDDTLSVTGSVSAWDPLSVGAEVSGLRITAVNVDEGDYVKKGQILTTLNSSLLEAQLEQAKARLQSSAANLKKSIQPNRQEDINALRGALAQAQANTAQEEAHRRQARVNLANCELNAGRWTALARVGAESKLDAETKQLALDTARQELLMSDAKIKAARSMEDQAHEKMLEAERGGRLEDVDISRATIAETRGQIRQLQQQIAQTIIRAPDDGLVSKRDAHIGDITNAGTPLFSIIRLNRLELRAQVSDIDLAQFKPGQTVSISSTEDEKGAVPGKVKLVSPQVDPMSRLGTVRIDLPSSAGLKPGMFVHGQVDLGHRKAITVPTNALISRNGEFFVFTLDGTRAISTQVKVGVRADKFVEISEGLKPGQVVVDKGARFLSDRDFVRVSQ
jgi:HlyD family secretion protein